MENKKKPLWLQDAWYPVALSSELKQKPISRTLMNQALVIFRHLEGVACLLDRCPHRRVPLSMGRVVDNNIECPYHGWQFNYEGRCQHIPSLTELGNCGRIAIRKFAVREQQGLIWVYAKPNVEPKIEPYQIEHYKEAGFGLFCLKPFDIEATLSNCLENFIDVNHTRYLHKGYARIDNLSRVIAKIEATKERMQVEYLNEVSPGGLLFKILTPKGQTLRHIDRLVLPSIVQSDYNFGTKYKFLAQDLLSPISDSHTRVFSITTYRTRLPHWFFKLLITPFAKKILRQDKNILKIQEQILKNMNSAAYCIVPSDLFTEYIQIALSDPDSILPETKMVEFNL